MDAGQGKVPRAGGDQALHREKRVVGGECRKNSHAKVRVRGEFIGEGVTLRRQRGLLPEAESGGA